MGLERTHKKKREHSRGFHETIDDGGRETFRAHGGCQSNEYVDLVVQLRVNAQSGKRLSGPLTEADVAETGCTGDLEDIFDRVGDIVPREVIDGEVPKLGRVGVVVDRLFGVLVAAVVAEPYVVTQLCEDKRDGTLWVCETDPNLGVHEKAMVQVDDRFAR